MIAMREPPRDAVGKKPEERFLEIERYFLEMLSVSGVSRAALYSRPKPGDAREPTEQQVALRWAHSVNVSVNDICIGIQRAFAAAAERRAVITSFRYCVPHIVARCNELRDSRVGAFGEQPAPRLNPEALKRIEARERARRVLGEKE
jgi:hypothetical protein